MSRIMVSLGAALVALCLSAPAGADALLGTFGETFELTTVTTGLSQATDFRFLPDGRRIFTELGGNVLIQAPDGSLVLAGTLTKVAPVPNGETGLLALEVHPDFPKTRLLYFYYSLSDLNGGSELDRDRLVSMVLREDDTLDLGSETVLIAGLRSPGIHHGGGLSIGPDRRLYLGVGDAGCLSGRAPDELATPANYFPTCLSNGQGKILRVELDGSVPEDNPLVGVGAVTLCGEACSTTTNVTGLGPGLDAIWAWGFRNPFRLWVDPLTGVPWVGDVGERSFEELTLARPGGHHGWPWREGRHGWSTDKCTDTVPSGPCVDPVYECQHGGAGPEAGCLAITGGAILDDCSWPPPHRGRYFFADSGSAALMSLEVTAARHGVVSGSRLDLAVLEGWPIAVRPGVGGDLYVLTHFGRLVRLSPRVRESCEPPFFSASPLTPDLPPPWSGEPLFAATADPGVVSPAPLVQARGGGCSVSSTGRAGGFLVLVGLAALARRVAGRRR